MAERMKRLIMKRKIRLPEETLESLTEKEAEHRGNKLIRMLPTGRGVVMKNDRMLYEYQGGKWSAKNDER